MKLLTQLALAIAFVCLTELSTFSQDRSPSVQQKDVMAGCPTLDDCLSVLDQRKKTPLGGIGPGDREIAIYMQRFGEPAKQAMLARLNGDDRGWSNLAEIVLAEWPSLEPQDVPQLAAALARHPGGWVARALGKIPTPEAIKVLVEDIKKNGTSNQSGFVLSKMGARVIPYLLVALEDDRHWQETASLLGTFKQECIESAPIWAQVATDEGHPVRRRLAAIRAIDGCESSGRAAAPPLRPLLQSSQPELRDEARVALLHLQDISVLGDYVGTCVKNAKRQDRFESPIFLDCFDKIAGFGEKAQTFAPEIVALTNAANGGVRAYVAALLGYIGYQPAAPSLVVLLKDADWRVVYAAARSLSWLGTQDAKNALLEVSRTHWLPEVRKIALVANESLKPGGKSIPKPVYAIPGQDGQPRPNLEVNALLVPDIALCSTRWRFGDLVFAKPTQRSMAVRVPASGKLKAGELSGTDMGEWGGGLYWNAGNKVAQPLYQTNSLGLAAADEGAVAAFGEVGMYANIDEHGRVGEWSSNGPSGYGFVLWAARDEKGEWTLEEVARLPRSPDAIADISPNRFAAWVGGRAIVFDLHGIEGIATCE
jgi:HEAT repeat protein